jgi:hypothetical protein
MTSRPSIPFSSYVGFTQMLVSPSLPRHFKIQIVFYEKQNFWPNPNESFGLWSSKRSCRAFMSALMVIEID